MIFEIVEAKFVAVAPAASLEVIWKPFCFASSGQVSLASVSLVGMSLL